MLIFDQLKKDDPQLRMIAVLVLGGLGLLLAGLWWVQIVSARDYQANLETQCFRTVRIPAVRGKILDRNGVTLAENRPSYNVSLYLAELRSQFQREYERIRPVRTVTNSAAFWRRALGAPSVTTQYVRLKKAQIEALACKARYSVASNVVSQVSLRLRQPLSLNASNFERHYETRLALPCPVLTNLNSTQIARFEEQSTSPMGVDLEVQSTRFYPYGTTAAHVLGHMRRDDSSMEGEEAFFSFRLPDYRGSIGVESGFDKELRGMAGAKSVLVNNAGYRQTENIWSPAEPGLNVVLTIDLPVQQAAEQALQKVGPDTRGAVIVMNVNSGDILALVSLPPFNPNSYIPRLSLAEAKRIADLHAERNCATYENYMPGSIFKMVVGMAALEAGWNPEEIIHIDPNPAQPTKGHKKVGNHVFKDTAPHGDFNFKRALKLSSNSYFITCGLRIGPERIIRMAQRLHFGERVGLPTLQDVPGSIPSLRRLNSGWTDGNTANICIGQDPIWVTPIQIAVLTSAIANGGKVLGPRLVDRVEAQDPTLGVPPLIFPAGRVPDQLGVSDQTITIMHDAMLADTEDPDGTGKRAAVPGLRICAKTGTAQVQDEHNVKTGLTTWFASFAPYEKPQWAVVVMVEDGFSGGLTCAPVAHDIYVALLNRERESKGETLAKAH
ncbi:MAG: penicillin-binding transpeptidase domain-containing protein [Verrucomicrobia bacterium]|nr:penicillin-binding transpeptidase domain-containing protein [Verrucomicrobiota bacterium]